MAVLKNIKHERFAACIASGCTNPEAYKAAGFVSKYPDQAASRLKNTPTVKARIEELTARITNRAAKKATERAAITKEWILLELQDNAMKAAEVKGGSSVRNRALELLGKEFGMFQEKEPTKPLTLEDLSTEDLEKLLALPVVEDGEKTGSEANPVAVQ
jgi:hypothetical protein